MTQEEKDLIFKDLCTRLPYGVKVYIKIWSKLKGEWIEGIYTVRSIDPSLNDIYTSTENGSVGVILGHSDYSIEPYLFPLSSMTEEQKELESKKTVYIIVLSVLLVVSIIILIVTLKRAKDDKLVKKADSDNESEKKDEEENRKS